MPNRMNPQKSESTPKKTSHQGYESEKELIRGRREEENKPRSSGKSERESSDVKREDKPRKQ